VAKSDKDFAALIAQELNIDPFAALIAASRGFDNIEDIDEFFDPYAELTVDPFSIKDMDKAAERVNKAIDEFEFICVFGDYDADGVTAAAVLCHFLQNVMSAEVIPYIPDRISEGYGMSAEAIDKLSEEGVTLIVTVDNGIVAFEQIEYAISLGMDVVVTDHHKCAERLPECSAVVDPCILKEDTPLSQLCGAGVAFTLIRALAEEIGANEEIARYIPIVMIGTLGDVVPLVGDNRVIVKYGLEHIHDFNWVGLEKLLNIINEGKTSQPSISSMFISFQLVPKLNAAGRLGNAMRAFELLVCDDDSEAEQLARELMNENAKRQETEAEIAEKAMQEENLKTTDADAVVVALGEDWHHGVIGIVASRLTDKYKKTSL
jgi:single-stranded-DNA-specific exonuclease